MNRPVTKPELVGRTQLVKDVTAALADRSGFGALLMGESGVGKTALARTVVRRLRWTAPVVTVTGGSSLRSIPFGALAPYLHTLSVADADSPVAILRAVMDYLSRRTAAEATVKAQHPPLLVVDDAHELDDSSSALIAQLVSARRAKVLVMSRDVETAPAEFITLGADGLLARFDLGPLDAESVGVLSRQILDGPVLTGTVQALVRATGGNPMFLRAVLERGEGAGYLERRNEVWRLTGEQSVMHLQLGDLIRARLRSRSAEEIAALEVVALAEPIALDTVSQCVDPALLARLREDRMVTVSPAPEQAVSLEHPLYGEVLRAQVPAARSMAIRRTVLAALDPSAQSLEGFLRFVSWGLDCGILPDDETLLRAAMVANGLRDHEFALRAARAVTAPTLRGRALTQMAEVEARRGDVDYARELIDEALVRCTDPIVAKEATLLSFELNLGNGASTEELLTDVARWRELVTRLEAADDVAAGQSQLGFRLLECRVRILDGRFDGVEEDLTSVLADPDATPEIRVGALILLAEFLGTTARSIEAGTRSGAALQLIAAEGADLLKYREAAVARHVFLLVSSGRPDEAEAALGSYLTAHPRSTKYFAGWSDFVEGVGALRNARNSQARDRLLLALEALRESDALKVLTLLIGMSAYACALAGDTARALELVGEFERTPQRGSRSVRLGGHVFLMATAALLGETPGARATLIGIAADAETDGLKEVAELALRLSMLLGDRNALEPLVRVLEDHEGQAAADLRAFARAALNGEADAMVAAATHAGEHGNLSFEFAGLSMALQVMGEQRSDRRSRAVQRRLVILGEQREGPVPAPLATASPAAATPSLTPTEQRIVALVREGYSNREIADSKSVSIRTVEGHLYRVFAKLGVSRREDLRES